MKQNILEKLVMILRSEREVNLSYVNDMLSDNLNQKSRRQFVEIINCLRDQSIKKVINKQDNIIELFFGNIEASLLIKTDEYNKMTRLEIVPLVNNSDDTNSLYDSLLELEAKLYLYFYGNNEQVKTNSVSEKFAIASLIKIFVGVIILEANEMRLINLDNSYQISQSDLSYLSSGISEKNIGQNISIRELLSYLFLASDNTAMDILLSILPDNEFTEIGKKISHEFEMEIVPTKEILSRAWCDPNLPEEIWREKSVKEVKWTEGYDYFANPKVLNVFIGKLLSYKWTPFTELSPIIYKGGNAPGVLSGLWGNKNTGNFVYFILNREWPFNIIEEMYCYRCVYNFLEKNITEKNHE
jgi:penB